MISARLTEYALAAAVTGLCCWGAYSWAHGRGYSAAEAHYEPILAQIRQQAEQAAERAKDLERSYAAINQTIATEEAQRAEDAKNQRDDALRRLADMRVRLASAIGRTCEVPGVLSGTGSPNAAPGDPAERPERADERLVELGRGCQRDRDRLALWQEWYRAIAASQPSPQTP